jgi:3-methyladenine DNA glycosylase/8-oxoguanine DNA glycosylase
MARLYRLDDSHTRQHYQVIGERWKPFATIGSWYCWRYLELDRAAKKRAKAARA